MSYDYQAEIDMAVDMLGEYGAPATIKRKPVVAGGYNPQTGVLTRPETSYDTTAVMWPQLTKQMMDRHKGEYKAGDVAAYVPQVQNGNIAPAVGDSFVCQGTEYEVIWVDTLAPGIAVVMYTLGLRSR
jgi:hypothetical protein